MAEPKPGDKIYVPSMIYLTHGADDFQGGLCTVARILTNYQGDKVTFLEIEENPGRLLRWDIYLGPSQESLKEKYGDQKGHLDPDLRPEFNRGSGPESD